MVMMTKNVNKMLFSIMYSLKYTLLKVSEIQLTASSRQGKHRADRVGVVENHYMSRDASETADCGIRPKRERCLFTGDKTPKRDFL